MPIPIPIPNNTAFYTAIDLWFKQCTLNVTTLIENTDPDSIKYSPDINVYATYGSISDWKVATVTSMTSAFDTLNGGYHATTKARIPFFNKNISSWDTHLVEDMRYMFRRAKLFNNNGASLATTVNGWNTIKVKYMDQMFYMAEAFNQDISSWDTSEVINMTGMFTGAKKFNNNGASLATSGDLWKTTKVKNMLSMFALAEVFNQDISSWDTSEVINMSFMFNMAKKFNNNGASLATSGDLWKTRKVTNMTAMFQFAEAFNQDISSWDTSEVINMSFMFNRAKLFNNNGASLTTRGDLWNTIKVTNMSSMFQLASAFNQDISSWDTRAVTDMSDMFSTATVYNGLGIYKWKLKPVTKPNINGMFILSAVPGNTNDVLIRSMWQKKYGYTNAELTNAGLTSTAQETTLSYPPGTKRLIINKEIEPILATVTTVTGLSYSIISNPTIPAGLSIDPSTGTITGTPTEAVANKTYTIILTDGNSVEWARETIILEVKSVVASGQLIYNGGVVSVTIVPAI